MSMQVPVVQLTKIFAIAQCDEADFDIIYEIVKAISKERTILGLTSLAISENIHLSRSQTSVRLTRLHEKGLLEKHIGEKPPSGAKAPHFYGLRPEFDAGTYYKVIKALTESPALTEPTPVTLDPSQYPENIAHLLALFTYAHLPPPLQEVSRPFCVLAHQMARKNAAHPETAYGLRDLMHAKDCAVRAAVAAKPTP